MIEVIYNTGIERKKINNLSKADYNKIIIYQVKNNDNHCILLRKDTYYEFIPLSYPGKGRFKTKNINEILETLLFSGRKIFIFENLLEAMFYVDIHASVLKFLENNYTYTIMNETKEKLLLIALAVTTLTIGISSVLIFMYYATGK
ncbi:hypothetical protein KY334_04300 [Candidatus Woesearchaeota archaeon]|nr:hypothetical protein [Candidatus Woesearchaeota archaeon]